MKKKLIFLSLLLASFAVKAQLTIDAELRPRFEYRHGFKTLIPDGTDAATFVSQRTRLNTKYIHDKLTFYVSVQDVRVWGDVPQLNTADKNGLALHQAWAAINLNPNFALKLGRQEIVYDDSRIFGNVGWAQQARSHDAALFRYNKNAFKLDVGFAYNQESEKVTGNLYTLPNYKAFQYAYLSKKWDNFYGSFLFLNNGLQFSDGINDDEIRYSQTAGTHLKYKKNAFGLNANLYYQFGNDVNDNSLSAYLVALEASYKVSDKFTAILGFENQSGNKYGAPSDGDNKAFMPFYGTNHKFNGFMDYFYVGNHANNVGLLDIYAKAKFKLNANSSLYTAIHNFAAAEDINDTADKQLGTEVDLVYSYKLQKDIGFKVGYSHMFASDSMELLKGTTSDNTNNWGWIMVTVNPTLFSSKK